MSTASTPTSATEHLHPATTRTLAALIVGGAAAILDSTIVTIALDHVSTDLHSTPTTIQWVVTAYLLALVAAIPLSGWTQSTFGGKRSWMATLTIFVIFSVACACAWNDTSLIVFRALQGFGAGMIFPLMQTLAVQAIGKASTKVMATTIAAISVPLALGPVIGPVLGGIVLNAAGWRWLFLINVPLIGVGLVMAWRLIAPDAPRSPQSTRVDVIGLALLIPSLVCIVLGLSNVASDGGFGQADVLVPLAGGLALIGAFITSAVRRGDRAAVDISLLRLRSLAASSGTLFTAGATMFAGMFLLPLYWQQVRGDSILSAALVLVPQGVGALLARIVAGRLAAQFGARALTIGAFLLTALATIPFAVADPDASGWWLGCALFVRGLGVGAVIMAPMMVAYADVEHEEMAHATMVTRIVQQIGASLGIAVVAVVLQNSAATDVTAGYQTAFWWLIGITAVALIPAIAFRRESLDDEASATKG
ncbi:DHA2 family efflux MFS transporter permease subunit [Paramicrobacterium chengjingii]|uniref:DHA2 family efflux MFS transporter permease subunit n=1 Tax=Paramicrobacterium chengjingii TaxID=2769067 RepID=UPI0014224A6E|nr:DHA2 family efflux MFS transporter permease subunit [Microbacterium chengjingii]